QAAQDHLINLVDKKSYCSVPERHVCSVGVGTAEAPDIEHASVLCRQALFVAIRFTVAIFINHFRSIPLLRRIVAGPSRTAAPSGGKRRGIVAVDARGRIAEGRIRSRGPPQSADGPDLAKEERVRAAIRDVPKADAAVEEQHSVVVDIDRSLSGVVTARVVRGPSARTGTRTTQQ